MKFVLPTEENRDDVLAFYKEIEESGSECIGCRNGKDYDKWLSEMQDRHSGKNLPDGYVRENFYLCYDESGLVGVFSLKFSLTEYLEKYGGHIGYAVRPSKRNRGFATQILKQGKELAEELGFGTLICVCDEDNAASEKVIIKNGGVFIDRLCDEEEKVFVKRYKI